jgi:hypothetical protein
MSINKREKPTTLHQELNNLKENVMGRTGNHTMQEMMGSQQHSSDVDSVDEPAGKNSIDLYNELDLAMEDSRRR